MCPRAISIALIVFAFITLIVSIDHASADTYTKLLLHGDGQGTSFVDSHSPAYTVSAVGEATQSPTQARWGKAMYFDGSGDYLQVPDSDDWNFGSGDFTIDFWANMDNPNYISFFGQSISPTNAPYFHFMINSIGNLVLHSTTSAGNFGLSSSSLTWNAGQWYHIALIRQGETLVVYRDGINVGSSSISGSWYDQTVPFSIGAGHYISSFKGYMDEFRISKGIARWTSNFTPPTAPYDTFPTVTLTATPPTTDWKNGPTQSTLFWTSTNASGVTIEPGIGPVDLTGSTPVSPEGTTTYTITATGEYGSANGMAVVNVLNGYTSMGDFTIKGKLGVGTLNPQNALSVNGIVSAKEVKVSSSGWSDYVFDEKYALPSLEEVEDFVRSNKHLPGIPAEREIEEKGLTVSEMFSLQMRKIEELVLYVIELRKESNELRKENNDLKRRLEAIGPAR